jgi:hypothetical protein
MRPEYIVLVFAGNGARCEGSMSQGKLDRIYQRIGEVVVGFQWVENQLEQIIWALRDPHWKGDPRIHTADVWFKTLVDDAEREMAAFIARVKPEDPGGWGTRFPQLLNRCRELAKRRNRIVHATFVEIKVGDDLAGILLSDMRRDKATNQITLDQETLSDDSFRELMEEIAAVAVELGFTHTQLIHWIK